MSYARANLSYDRAENIVHMSFEAPVTLSTQDEISAHFEHVIAFWRANAGGKKSYFVVNFDNVTIGVAEIEFYAQQTKRAHALCAIASVRYGGDPLQRTVTRLAGMKVQQPSNFFATREDAIARVRAMRNGEVKDKPSKGIHR